jgi:hypothetical protein
MSLVIATFRLLVVLACHPRRRPAARDKGLLNMFRIPCDAPPDVSGCSVLGTWASSCDRAPWVPVPAEVTAAAWVPVPAGLVFCVGALNGVNVVAANEAPA